MSFIINLPVLQGSGSGSGGNQGMRIEIVEKLPVMGESDVIYLVKKSKASSENEKCYDEYLWVGDGYDKIGCSCSGEPLNYVELDFTAVVFDKDGSAVLDTQEKRDAVGFSVSAAERIKRGTRVKAKFLPMFVDEENHVFVGETVAAIILDEETACISSIAKNEINYLYHFHFLHVKNSADTSEKMKCCCFYERIIGEEGSYQLNSIPDLEEGDLFVRNPFCKGVE